MTVPSVPVAVQADRSFFGHPRGLALLFGAEMWERFSYYGMRAILVLYLVNALGWRGEDAARLYGTYTGLVYLTPLIGGWLADRFIGTRRSLVIGGIVIALGHFALAFESMAMFYTGLGLIIVGTGFFKPNVSTMVGQLYVAGDTRRDAGFTIFYMGINTGAFIAPLICGGLAENPRFGWHVGFAAAGVGMVLGLILYLWGRDRYLPGVGLAPAHVQDEETAAEVGEIGVPEYRSVAIIGALAGLVVAVLGGLRTWSETGFVPWLFSLAGLMSIAYGTLIGAAFSVPLFATRGEERRRVIALILVFFFVTFFWLLFEQAGSSLTLFADRDTDRTIGAGLFGQEVIPASWFQSIQPLAIIILAPVAAWVWGILGRRGKEPSTAVKMVIGLFFAGLGFFLLIFAGQAVDAGLKVAPLWLAWFLALSAANFLGGFMAALIETIPKRADFFIVPTATAWIAGLVMLLLVPLLKRLTRSVPAA
ncbi:MAG: peptide MFS transporter [Gemmatimonadaceae bacterium]|nr:peptide MFS transporter [Gemmatimonadaceae bacterium]